MRPFAYARTTVRVCPNDRSRMPERCDYVLKWYFSSAQYRHSIGTVFCKHSRHFDTDNQANTKKSAQSAQFFCFCYGEVGAETHTRCLCIGFHKGRASMCHGYRSLSSLFLSPPLYLTLMLLGIPVVVDANQQNITRVFRNFLRIVFVLDLADGSLCVLVIFQFDDQRR